MVFVFCICFVLLIELNYPSAIVFKLADGNFVSSPLESLHVGIDKFLVNSLNSRCRVAESIFLVLTFNINILSLFL